jgi:hypothetical protein
MNALILLGCGLIGLGCISDSKKDSKKIIDDNARSVPESEFQSETVQPPTITEEDNADV